MVAVVVAAMVYTGLFGCSFLADDPASTAPPESLAECNHGPSSRGSDVTFPSGLHWLEDEHAYDQAGEIFVCIDPEVGGTVTVTGPEGVEVSPTEQRVDTTGSGVLRFEVRVEPGASGGLEARTTSDGMGSTLVGPSVETDDDTWAFREGD